MALPTRSSLFFLSFLVLWTTGAGSSSPTAPVRVGVVLDLRSAVGSVGRERRACVSMALRDFDLKHPRYARRVELLVRDSLGDLNTSTHAGTQFMLQDSLKQTVM